VRPRISRPIGAASRPVRVSHQCRSRPSGRCGAHGSVERVATLTPRDGRELDGDLNGGVPATDNHHPHSGELVGAAVVGRVQHGPAELRQPD
jgi:hypothetical protein